MRPFIEIRLTDNPTGWAAAIIIQEWKSQRAMTRNFCDAVAIFDALLKGDAGPLFARFPLLASSAAPAGAPAPKRAKVALETTAIAKSETEDVDDLLDGLGL